MASSFYAAMAIAASGVGKTSVQDDSAVEVESIALHVNTNNNLHVLAHDHDRIRDIGIEGIDCIVDKGSSGTMGDSDVVFERDFQGTCMNKFMHDEEIVNAGISNCI